MQTQMVSDASFTPNTSANRHSTLVSCICGSPTWRVTLVLCYRGIRSVLDTASAKAGVSTLSCSTCAGILATPSHFGTIARGWHAVWLCGAPEYCQPFQLVGACPTAGHFGIPCMHRLCYLDTVQTWQLGLCQGTEVVS